MPRRFCDLSPQLKARIAGVCQLLEALTATFGQVIVLSKLVVTGNPAATAANFLAHQRLLWFGFAASLAGVIFHIAWALLLYQLLKPVHRTLSLFAAFVILVGCSVQAFTTLLYIAPTIILQGAGSLSAFTPAQLDAISFLFIKLNSQAFDLYLVFFGLWCILTGYLIFRSTFFPRILGVLLAISGCAWALFLFPPLAHRLFPVIAAASAIGEIPLELWCILKGANSERWSEQAGLLGAK